MRPSCYIGVILGLGFWGYFGVILGRKFQLCSEKFLHDLQQSSLVHCCMHFEKMGLRRLHSQNVLSLCGDILGIEST